MNFELFLNANGEIGYVKRISSSIVFCDGLPGVKLSEIVIFENDEIGQVFSTGRNLVEIIVISKGYIKVGTKVARTGQTLKISVGDGLFGNIVSPPYFISFGDKENEELRLIMIE